MKRGFLPTLIAYVKAPVMPTISKFQQRDPLTLRVPRTLKEADTNGMDWWVSAEAAAAEEEHVRAMFDAPTAGEECSEYRRMALEALARVEKILSGA